jgi:hypothetical protein
MLDTKGCKYTHSGRLTFIVLSLKQYLHERASMFSSTYISCLVSLPETSATALAPVD